MDIISNPRIGTLLETQLKNDFLDYLLPLLLGCWRRKTQISGVLECFAYCGCGEEDVLLHNVCPPNIVDALLSIECCISGNCQSATGDAPRHSIEHCRLA